MSNAKRERGLLKQLTKYRVPSGVTTEAISSYLESLDCPRALTVYMLYRSGEHEQLAALKFDPLHYSNVMEVRDAYAATSVLSKAEFLKLNYDLDERALEKFERFELSCKSTNSRFKDLSTDPLFKGPVVYLHNAIIRKIDRILGEIRFQDFVEMANWGPGATTVIPSLYASSANKFQFETGITRRLLDLFPPATFSGVYPSWAREFTREGGSSFTLERGNKIVTVPKDATANRVIAIEPGFNLWFQKGIGLYMRKQLLRYGVDLNYQSKNQSLAKAGSISGSLATIDFSSASDSISHGIVEALLSPRWFTLLDACRSHYGTMDGETRKWAKFSSMGNGFTFELESLIFYATALCCAEYLHVPLSKDSGFTVSVYGDDVIIPVNCLPLFAEMCQFYGFTMNMKKSHFSSTFRESCGKHFVSGIEVTPIYLKSRLTSIPAVFRFANAIRKSAHIRGSKLCCDVRLKKTFDYLVKTVPSAFRLRIDSSLGDGGFISNWDEAVPTRAKHSIEGWMVKHVTDAGVTRKSGVYGLLLSHLWALERRGLSTSPFRNRAIDLETTDNSLLSGNLHPFLIPLRKVSFDLLSWGVDMPEMNNDIPVRGKSKMKFSRSIVAQWYDLGPWL